jgi:hypothetical protein
MGMEDVRRFALSLPEATEEPHFDRASFRVRGKIFATVSPDERHINVFVDEPERELFRAARPQAYEKLFWGKKVVGLKVALSAARPEDVQTLLESAWARKAPKALARAFSTRGA